MLLRCKSNLKYNGHETYYYLTIDKIYTGCFYSGSDHMDSAFVVYDDRNGWEYYTDLDLFAPVK